MKIQPAASHYIHGRYVDDVEGESLRVICPTTGKAIANFHSATTDIVEYAIRSAKESQPAWAILKPAERARILYRAAELLLRKNDDLARIETINTGRAIQETLTCDIIGLSEALKFSAGAVLSFNGNFIDLGPSFAYTRHEPFGVCVGIGAWNYPIYCAGSKAAPALVMGNSMVFKPSEITPLSALILAETFIEAGLPPGVFNVIQGGADVGRLLVSHPVVRKISFTGSVSSGQKVMSLAGSGIKHTTMELGGKSPLIIFDDANLKNAVQAAMIGNFYSTGQICSNGTRVFVHENIKVDFLDLLCERTRSIRIGDPLDPETNMGPLISKRQQNKILDYIDSARKEGATLLLGGGVPKIKGSESGFFIEPTIFSSVDDHMLIAREEIFGPVMSVFTFQSENEVVERANNTHYGLAAGVFTKDISRAHRIIAQLQAGTCWINNYNSTPIEMPFGGFKHSGVGKENALDGLREYSQLKSVYVEMGDVYGPF